MIIDHNTLKPLLLRVNKPAQYIGGEVNAVVKEPSKELVRFAFCFPDSYDIGMSYVGLQILYHLVNQRETLFCERAFAPMADMEQELRDAGLPLYTLETKTPLADMDVLGFTLQYEMTYTNLLNMLDLGGIPLRAEDRTDEHPLILAGGPCAFQCEPIADFLDIVIVGDGEAVLPDLLERYGAWKKSGGPKQAFLQEICTEPGVYVPSFYDPLYGSDGAFQGFQKNMPTAPDRIRKAIAEDIDSIDYPTNPIVPYIDVVHDRAVVEIFRGCTRGCRFCQAGIIYRPVRERSAGTVSDIANAQLASTGHDELSLLSLSSSDHSDFEALVRCLMQNCKESQISLSLPSLRLDNLGFSLLEEAQGVRKSGLTFAPEAGTQRLRDVINKNLTEEEILSAVEQAVALGWKSVKLYFMIGLPTETDEDLEGIATLAQRIMQAADAKLEPGRGRFHVTVSTSNFVPKPFTPFMWSAQDTVEELKRKQFLLKDLLRKVRGVTFRYHDPLMSYLEAVMARSDRRMGDVILDAWGRGCRFDAWSEHFRREIWIQILEEYGIDEHHASVIALPLDAALPYELLDTGVELSYLKQEYERALQGQTTEDCRLHCHECGIREHATCFAGGVR